MSTFAQIPGIVCPVLVFISSRTYYAYWRPLYSLNLAFFINSGCLVVLSIFGFLLLQAKVTNKFVAILVRKNPYIDINRPDSRASTEYF